MWPATAEAPISVGKLLQRARHDWLLARSGRESKAKQACEPANACNCRYREKNLRERPFPKPRAKEDKEAEGGKPIRQILLLHGDNDSVHWPIKKKIREVEKICGEAKAYNSPATSRDMHNQSLDEIWGCHKKWLSSPLFSLWRPE